MRGALDGIRVIELAEMVSGPFCSKLCADYGADVIKVEPPSGDASRGWGPFPGDVRNPEKSGLYFFLNTNKRAVTLDVSKPRGRQMMLDLLRDADVFIENNRPQQMRAWGLDYETISKANPDLVMISITPFGQTGPYAEWSGYDINAFHLTASGSRYLGRPGEPPLEPGTFTADFFGAYAATAWGLAALFGRALISGGQHVDVSTAEVIAALFTGAENIGGYYQDGVFETRTGIGMPLGAPATILPCKDGYVWMLALEPGQWKGLARAMGDPDWMQLEMFLDMFTRAQNAEAMYPLITEWTMEHTKQEIMDLCQANGCPVSAVYTVAEVAEHPHLRARGFVLELEHPVLGKVKDIGPPIKLGEGVVGPQQAAPLLGQHNAEVYESLLGLSAGDLADLKSGGVI